jgi:hypothetical protein
MTLCASVRPHYFFDKRDGYDGAHGVTRPTKCGSWGMSQSKRNPELSAA